MWRALWRLLMFCLVIVSLIVGFKLYRYYKENELYAFFVLKNISLQYKSSIIEGYMDQSSYYKKDSQTVFVNPRKIGKQWIRLFDISGNKVDSVRKELSVQKRNENAGVEGFGFKPSFRYSNPNLKSGLYLWEKVVPFIIKDTGRIAVLYPTNTINAYNISGGNSLYSMFTKQSPIISFQRPTFPAVSFHTGPIMKWLWKQKDLSLRYICDYDMEDSSTLRQTKLLVVIGHSEYWSRKARQNFDAFVKRGGNVLILSGNVMWWQVRYSKKGNEMICYKLRPDPIKDSLLTTTNWISSTVDYPIKNSIGADFHSGGFGRKAANSFGGLKIINTNSTIFRNTGIEKKDILKIPTKEYDGTDVVEKEGQVELDRAKLAFYKIELLGFDHTINDYGNGHGTFIIFQKTNTSGIVIHTGSADWCSEYGIGGQDSLRIQKLTRNMIDGLYNNDDLF
jgi:hypothetical protein